VLSKRQATNSCDRKAKTAKYKPVNQWSQQLMMTLLLNDHPRRRNAGNEVLCSTGQKDPPFPAAAPAEPASYRQSKSFLRAKHLYT